MSFYEQWKAILKIQKFRRMVSYAGFYSFATLISYAFTSNTIRAGFSHADQYYAAYPASIELLTNTAKLYKAALGNCFEQEEWGPIEFSIMAKHFERQGKHHMPTMLNTWRTFSRMANLMAAAKYSRFYAGR